MSEREMDCGVERMSGVTEEFGVSLSNILSSPSILQDLRYQGFEAASFFLSEIDLLNSSSLASSI